MTAPNTVRSVPRRTIGSGTRLLEEFPLPAAVYYPGQWLRAAWARKLEATAALLVLWGWYATGSLWAGLVLSALIAGLILFGVFAVKQHRSEHDVTLGSVLEGMRRRRRLARQWPTACLAAGLVRKGSGVHPRLRRVKELPHGGGFAAVVACGAMGVPTFRLVKEAPTLAEVVGCRELIVTTTSPGVARVEFHWADPVGRHLGLNGLPPAPSGELAYGIRPDGSAATIRSSQSVLIGGLTGFGKSNLVWALLADVMRQQVPTRLYVSDPKGGIELKTLGAVVGQSNGCLEVRRYATTTAETLKMIDDLEGALRARQGVMERSGARKHTPTPENPLVVLLLDETLPLGDMLRKGVDSPLGRIAYTGRAAGYVVWANSQVAQVDSIGRFRDLIPQRVCFATPTPQVTDSILGQGSDANGAECSEIRSPGVGYSYADGTRRPLKFRAAEVTDAETRIIAGGQMPGSMRLVEGGERTSLYRHYDEHGQLLYVGISNDYARRTDEHSDTKPWFAAVASTRVEHYPSRKDALDAEVRAIKAELPLHNDVHNRANPRRVVAQMRRVLT